ncbi:MAG: transcriptional regulator [Halobacteriales archaeon]|nr:transcriptional regulator [Halobacteriales archaeon]
MATARRLSTGIEPLDRELNGGLLPGTITAFAAPPASQSELLLYELTRERPTLYLTTTRSEQGIRDALERTAVPTGDPVIRRVGGDMPLDNVQDLTGRLRDEANLIIDPLDLLESSERNRYVSFLNRLQTHMQNTSGIALLHCMKGDEHPPMRDLTMQMVDTVFDLELTTEGEDVETRLSVPKFRGGEALNETIKLELADRVRVDTSRDIA